MTIQRGIVLAGSTLVALMVTTGWTLAAEAKAGKGIYDKRCVSCHGSDGKGNPAMVKALGEKGLNLIAKEVAGANNEELLKVILEGKGKMPATKGLSKDEAKQVLDYTRSLSK
jgi:mono/diheme cytochrome c family protein